MARHLKTNAEIDDFIASVLKAANHHGTNVEAVIQPLADAVRSHLNLSRDKVEVYERNGEIARTCWVSVNGNRYAFTYNYEEKVIDLRKKSLQGKTLFQFDNSTSCREIKKQAGQL